MVDSSTNADSGGYNLIHLIGPEISFKNQWGLDLNLNTDFKIGTTEMEPIIRFGDQIRIKRDYITGEVVTTPEQGDIVVLKSNEPLKVGKRFLIRRYCIVNNAIRYEASNPQFPPITDLDSVEVVGIVSLSVTQF